MTGANGLSGTSGATGGSGNAGASGGTGANGTNGPSGASGSQGLTGASGSDGVMGATGSTGATGAQGTDGKKVVSGACGVNGPATGLTCPSSMNQFLYFCNSDGRFFQCTGGVWTFVHDLTGGSGASGVDGAMGSSGPTGATGSYAAKPVSEESWHSMTLGTSARTTDSPPACMEDDISQDVFLRGHLTLLLSPVPATGGQLLSILPRAPDGSCYCSVSSMDVIATSTAFTFPGGLNSTQVCIVRLLVSKRVPADVNLDGVINMADENVVGSMMNSGVSCVPNCGRADVNRDGFVDQADLDTLRASAPYGTNVSCGAVYATSFSCGASRSSPPNPAVAISIDQVRFPAAAGQLTTLLRRQEQRTWGREAEVDVEFAHAMLSERLGRPDLAERDSLEAVVERVNLLKNKDLLERSEMTLALSREQMETLETDKRSLLVDILVAVGTVVVASAILARTMRG